MKKVIIIPIFISFLFLSACSINNKDINIFNVEKNGSDKENSQETIEEEQENNNNDEINILDKEEPGISEGEEKQINDESFKTNNLELEGKNNNKDEVDVSLVDNNKTSPNFSKTEIAKKAEDFANNYLADKGTSVVVKDVVLEDCLYKLEILLGDQIIYSYFDKDTENYYPQALDIDEISSQIGEEGKTYSENEIKERVSAFINSYLVSGEEAIIQGIEKEDCLYKLDIKLPSSNNIINSFITKDGKLFFPQIFNIAEVEKNVEIEQNKKIEIDNKTNKPQVELFVMSHCPYGTQMEKAILPAINTLGDSISFDIKFNSYAMHGETELNEQMLQYCLMEEQEDIYLDYLECFLVDGDSDRCLAANNINKSSLDNCISNVDEEYSIISDFENNVNYQGSYPGFNIFASDNERYGVQGSPTLVINGQTVYIERKPNQLLKTICTSFINQPDACSATLSTESPAPGFGFGETNNDYSEVVCN